MHNYTLADFDYDLPEELIAKYPQPVRTDSRLLVADCRTQTIEHGVFSDLTYFLNPQDLLIFNNTRVMPARLKGVKPSGGKVECLVERCLDQHQVWARLRSSKPCPIGSEIYFSTVDKAVVLEKRDPFFRLQMPTRCSIQEMMEKYGEVPLPPYMKREVAASDVERYQTVYAKQLGAVAAPTAGLHFTQNLLESLAQKGVEQVEVTLHVGSGTFEPVRSQRIQDHVMHQEYYEVTAVAAAQIQACQGRKVAVGTTSVRCLESAYEAGRVRAFAGETDIFIYPGYEFKVTQALLTNFHLPRSSLLMLVAAFAGYDFIMRIYRESVKKSYKFFSYGDCMLIIR